jgi:hypothetical protein
VILIFFKGIISHRLKIIIAEHIKNAKVYLPCISKINPAFRHLT